MNPNDIFTVGNIFFVLLLIAIALVALVAKRA